MVPPFFPDHYHFLSVPKLLKYRSYVTFAPTNSPPVAGAIYESDKSNSIDASHSQAAQLLTNYICSNGA
jgi:hypothetical protein